MNTVLFYDLESLTNEELQRVREAAGNPSTRDEPPHRLIEIAPASTVWPESTVWLENTVWPASTVWPQSSSENPPPSEEQPEPLQRVADHRGEDFLDRLMDWIDQVVGSEAAGGTMAPAQEILAAARYALLFDLAHPLSRWCNLVDLLHRFSPDRLIWVTNGAEGRAPAEIRALLASVPQLEPRWIELRRPNLLDRCRSAPRRLLERHWRAVERWRSRLRAALRRRPALEPAPVVLTEYFPNSVRTSLPVARALAERGMAVRWLPARQRVAHRLAEFTAGSSSEPTTTSMEEVVTSASRLLRGHWMRARRSALQQLLGLATTPLPTVRETPPQVQPLAELLRLLHHRGLPLLVEAAHWLEVYDQAWEHLKPRVVLSTTYSSIQGRAAALTLRRRGGRAAYLQHGIFPSRRVYSRFCHDLILVWGEHERRALEGFGVAGERLRCVGATLYDAPLREAWNRRSENFPAAGEPLSISFMASRSGGAVSTLAVSRRTLELVAGAARRIPGAGLTVKTHPADATGLPERILAAYPEVELIRQGNSQEIIRESDLVIVVSSTTGYEACVFAKPLIVCNLTGRPDFVNYEAYGAALAAEDENQLVHTILRLQNDKDLRRQLQAGRQRLFDELLNGGRGDAAESAARAIEDCLQATRAAAGNREKA
ncbi:MAG: hypothetical protein SX243_04760 [Acidobacteriota bacterium]|nr:hypothetical protein [Acidobacteriota bacterium]